MNADERAALLKEYFSLEGAQQQASVDRRAELLRAYEAGLPKVSFSRCPFTDEVFAHSLDTFGLDGLWWQHDMPIRAIVEELPETYFALTGAVQLASKPAKAPFTCVPGPEVPFVVPRMLLHDDVKAVVSHVRIGDQDAYPVVYYANPIPPMLERFNEWGANYYEYESPTMGGVWHDMVEEDALLDFNLGRWIESGDLFWIAPDDTKLVLKTTTAGCPYLDLGGRRSWAFIENGAVELRGGDASAKKAPAKKAPAKKAPAKKASARRR